MKHSSSTINLKRQPHPLMTAITLKRPTIASILFALGATIIPLSTPSRNTPAGRNAVAGGLGGALIGGLIGGRRAAVAGAITGGLIGAATTPSYRSGYYPSRPSSSMSYQYY